jgi:hypothetical protein
MTTHITRPDWNHISSQLTNDGFAILRGVPGSARARRWASELSPDDQPLRYLDDAHLPAPLDSWRRQLYERLVPIADSWNAAMGSCYRFPSEWSQFLARNQATGQRRTQSFVHRLGESSYEALHQCNEGEHVFPFQLVVLLSEPGTDFSGGELIVTERRPRMQTRPVVVPLILGDAALIPTAKRPVKGSHGYYSTDSKHGVSRVRSGERIGLELSFHYARV